MNAVVLTQGEPHQRYVINEVHRRLPVQVVVTTAPADRGMGPSPPRRAYWSAVHSLRLAAHGDWRALLARRYQARLQRLEQRLLHAALKTELGIDRRYALADGLNVIRVTDLNGADAIERIRELDPDVLLLIGCPIIREPVLSLPKVGTLNCHTALLPEFRGTGAEHWILLTGRHDRAGVTVHWATHDLDAGGIAAQRSVSVLRDDDPFRLRCRSLSAAPGAFAEVLNRLARGDRPDTPQPAGGRVYRARDLTPELRAQCYARAKRKQHVAGSPAVILPPSVSASC